jgi:hypothetical protein
MRADATAAESITALAPINATIDMVLNNFTRIPSFVYHFR